MSFLWFLSDLRTPAGDFFFQQITYLGQEIFVVAVICWLYWCVSKKKRLYSWLFLFSLRPFDTGS